MSLPTFLPVVGSSEAVPSPSATPSTYSATVSWDALPRATAYTLYQTPEGQAEVLVGTTTNTSYVVNGLIPLTNYSFRVVATVTTLSGTTSTTTLEATVLKSSSLVQGTSSLAVSSDWDAFTNGIKIPAEGITLSYPIHNWYSDGQPPIDRVSVLIGNLTNVNVSGMRIAYAIAPYDIIKNPFASSQIITDYGFGNVTNVDPTQGWVILPSNSCDITAGPTTTIRDNTWATYSTNESYKWVELPFGQFLTEFTVFVRVFLPEFTSGHQYASMYRQAAQGTSFLVHALALLQEAVSDPYGINLRIRVKNGDYVSNIQESSSTWAQTPNGGWGMYDPPNEFSPPGTPANNAPTIPFLATRWGT